MNCLGSGLIQSFRGVTVLKLTRSYKKHPCAKFNDRFFKKYSNRVMRKMCDLPDGNAYRKNGYSYNIHDIIYTGWRIKDLSYWFDRYNRLISK